MQYKATVYNNQIFLSTDMRNFCHFSHQLYKKIFCNIFVCLRACRKLSSIRSCINYPRFYLYRTTQIFTNYARRLRPKFYSHTCIVCRRAQVTKTIYVNNNNSFLFLPCNPLSLSFSLALSLLLTLSLIQKINITFVLALQLFQRHVVLSSQTMTLNTRHF